MDVFAPGLRERREDILVGGIRSDGRPFLFACRGCTAFSFTPDPSEYSSEYFTQIHDALRRTVGAGLSSNVSSEMVSAHRKIVLTS